MNGVKIRNIISLIMNIGMAVLVAFAVSWFFSSYGLKAGIGNMTVGGSNCFMFFTNDSNILAALCGLIVVPYNIKSIKSGKDEIPKWALLIKFTGTVAVALTLVVVVVFLGPIMGYPLMFTGCCLYLHLICPLIAIVSFCFFERGILLSKKQAILGVLPMFIYGNIYMINVIIRGVWIDFYCFNIEGYWYITYAVFPLFTYLLALGIRLVHNKTDKNATYITKSSPYQPTSYMLTD